MLHSIDRHHQSLSYSGDLPQSHLPLELQRLLFGQANYVCVPYVCQFRRVLLLVLSMLHLHLLCICIYLQL